MIDTLETLSKEMEKKGETDRLRKGEWEVRNVDTYTARRLVERYHYAGRASNTATYLHGLFPKGSFWNAECVGVAWWIPPTKSAALATYPRDWKGVLALSRMVIVPGVPKNACSFLLARSMKLIDRERWPCLVTYADTYQGHVGTIYKAANWVCLGYTKKYETYVLPDGKRIAKKRGNMTRTKRQMEEMGARLMGYHRRIKFVHIVGGEE